MDKEAKVSPYQQKTQRTCSAACLRAVLLHHGLDVQEEVLCKLIDIQHYGAELYQIVGAARALGFDAQQVEFKDLDEVRNHLKNDLPIICDVQSWTKAGSGHYVVLTEEKDGKAEVMDPNTPGNWRSMPMKEFEDRWWDGDNVFPGKKLRRPGILITPRES
jgi:ABC-type bacteriocin/lantibiotic exporter with double-glycine peptidase domain